MAVDTSTISSLGGGRLRAVPKDGTVLRGLPSKTLWEIQGGYRRQTFINTAGIDVDDGAIARIPTPPTPPPVTLVPFAPSINHSYRLRGSRTRFTALTVRGLPAGSKVQITCKGHGCPFKSHTYTPKQGKLGTPGTIRRRYLRAGTRLAVTAVGPAGDRKVVNFRLRKGKAPVRTIRCATAGGKLKAC